MAVRELNLPLIASLKVSRGLSVYKCFGSGFELYIWIRNLEFFNAKVVKEDIEMCKILINHS